ncbi:MAG: ABC transporter ATP-binding protein [Phycisphaerae bacterium]
MSESEAVVVTQNLTKVFKDFWLREKATAVAGLDLEIRPREVFGLLGPNGSGKSTTIKMIMGLLFPTRGRVLIWGRAPSDVKIKGRIGFLPEESYLYPFLDARETLDYYGRLFRQPRRERQRRIDMLLDMVGLSAAAYRRVGEYSKGMQRRIGLAQALINDPDLLILDEPTSGLDPIGTKKIKDLIQTLAARGKTVILSSHLLADVEDVCDRITILYGGKQRATGTISQLLARTDQMQLTTDLLDEATVEQIEALIVKSGHQVREVSNPRHRLEELFLQIVAEANAQKVKTGGAATGGGVAAFLMGDDGRQGEEAEGEAVIEDLVKAAAPAPEPEEPPQAQQQQEPETQRDVLDELVAGLQARGAEELDEPDAAERMDAAARQPKVDRSVIDDLLGNDQDDEER